MRLAAVYLIKIVEPMIEEDSPVKGGQEVNDPIDLMFGSVPELTRSWSRAKVLIRDFPPVPWNVWRVCNFVFGAKGPTVPPAGLLMGCDKIMNALSEDLVLGSGQPIARQSQFLKDTEATRICAVLVMHSLARRLATKPFHSIWSPMLDDALLRARIGFQLAKGAPEFGSGRGMLAGFAGRIGMVVLIATGEHQQGAHSLQQLARGASLSDVGLSVYGTDPMHVVAQIFSKSGLGHDAAVGALAYGSTHFGSGNPHQELWRSAMWVVEAARMTQYGRVGDEDWSKFGLSTQSARTEFGNVVTKLIRRGHDMHWII